MNEGCLGYYYKMENHIGWEEENKWKDLYKTVHTLISWQEESKQGKFLLSSYWLWRYVSSINRARQLQPTKASWQPAGSNSTATASASRVEQAWRLWNSWYFSNLFVVKNTCNVRDYIAHWHATILKEIHSPMFSQTTSVLNWKTKEKEKKAQGCSGLANPNYPISIIYTII